MDAQHISAKLRKSALVSGYWIVKQLDRRGIVHLQKGCTDFKSSKISLDFLDFLNIFRFFFQIFRIFSDFFPDLFGCTKILYE